MIEMLRCYWLEVHFVFLYNTLLLVVISCFVFLSFWPFCWLWIAIRKKIKFEILYRLCHRPCFWYEKLGWFCVQISCTKFLVRETWTICHCSETQDGNNKLSLMYIKIFLFNSSTADIRLFQHTHSSMCNAYTESLYAHETTTTPQSV